MLAAVLCLTTGTAGATGSQNEHRDAPDEAEGLPHQVDEPGTGPREAGSPEPAPASGAAGQNIEPEVDYSYAVLDPTTDINRKQLVILTRQQNGTAAPDTLHAQAAITTIANLQSSTVIDKFGYLMRHPTAGNQVGTTVSEAAVHSVQLGLTGTLGDWITAHVEILYDPQQSFGSGTNTALERNQLQVRRAYALFGSLDRSPFYVSLGKMAVPFGLTDTVNPFTASTVWHAFGGLANGVKIGYLHRGLSASLMGIQGGAQFRAANTPVNQTAVPSKLNNFALDVNYSLGRDRASRLLLGASYQRGTAFCQEFPVVHFEPCKEHNPAFDAYARIVLGNLTLKGEFAQTLDVWPGTFNPAILQFGASRVTSFDAGARYRQRFGAAPVDFSVEFSRFDAGPDGAPWEDQDQLVLGAAWFARSSAKLFVEYIRVEGYAPLNFISGGSIRDENGAVVPDRTHSDASARTNVLMIGANIAF